MAALALALALFAGIFALRLAVDNTAIDVQVLYAVPVALVAVNHGVRRGLIAAVLAVALFIAWTAIRLDFLEGGAVTLTGYLMVAVLALALVVGWLGDRLRTAAERNQIVLSPRDALLLGQRDPQLAEREKWEGRIRWAIERDRFVLHSQPIVDLTTGSTSGEELLIRMQGSGGPEDLIPPASFLPPAERFDLIGEIDCWVVRRALTLAARGHCVQVNLSGKSVGDTDVTREIAAGLDSLGANATNLTFEVTESAALEHLPAARDFAERLSELGCGLAIDDFGTGFGAFTYLMTFPVDYLKIDRSFVRNLHRSGNDQRVVRSMVTIAREFGQKTIVEGVEDAETLALLRELGVDYAQGYHLGPPMPVAA